MLTRREENILQVDLEGLEKLLVTNWASFINPQKFIAVMLSLVRDTNLPETKNERFIHKDNIQVKLSQFKFFKGYFVIWADFVIPKKLGTAVGTAEFRLQGETLEHLQTIGNFILR